jgi:hypothetical protein
MMNRLYIWLSGFLLNFRIQERQEKKRNVFEFINRARWRVDKKILNLFCGATMVGKDMSSMWRKRRIPPIRTWMSAAFLMLFATASVYAGDFVNTGTISNTGRIRVKYGVLGLPDSLGGMFEYFGRTQTVQGLTYDSLALTGDSVKTVSGSKDLAILENVSVASAVTLNIPSTQTMALSQSSGRLTENGIVHGKVTKTVNLNTSADSSDFGGIGLSVRSDGTAVPGTTQIVRYTGTAPIGASGAFTRYYVVTPSDTASRGRIIFTYNSTDDVPSGYSASTPRELWRSVNNGVTWRRQRTTQSGNQLQKSGNYLAGTWTASDTLHLLGRSNYEGDPDSLSHTGPDSLRSKTKQNLSPFIAKVTDVYGNSIANAKVRLAITSIPAGATGQMITDSAGNALSADSTVLYADANGNVKVGMKLGSKRGSYKLQAKGDSIATPQLYFTGYADASVSALATVSTPSSDSISAATVPIVIEAKDEDNLAVSDVNVKFEIVNAPSGASGYALLNPDSLTNSSGQAQAALRLGQKSGTYRIKVSSSDIDSVKYYNVVATPGVPMSLTAAQGSNQSKTILQPLDTLFTVHLTDRASNAIAGDTAYFNLTSVPDSTYGQSLSATAVVTDSLGNASTRLTLGSKVGSYVVSATASKLNGFAQQFSAKAIHGAAKYFAYKMGTEQKKTVLSTLDTALAVKVTDDGGNAIQNYGVHYVISSQPAGAHGASFSSSSTVTDTTILSDSVGTALAWLKLGSKVGTYDVAAIGLTSDTIHFKLIGKVGPAYAMDSISGTSQHGQIGDQLGEFTIHVADIGGNAIAGDTVKFSIASTPKYAAGDTLSTYAAVTDENGYAATKLTLGSRVGIYAIKASVTGVSDTTFSVSAMMVMADANHDNRQNIGDLTTVIDHILGKKLLTGYNFIRADIYPTNSDGSVGDGVVDISDLIALRDSLINGVWDPALDWLPVSASVTKIMAHITNKPMAVYDIQTTDEAKASMALTYVGSRLGLINTVPINGLQAIIYLKQHVAIDTFDVIFDRAKMMTVKVKTVGNEIHVLAYNMSNTPIAADSGALFRLPLKLNSVNDIDSVRVFVSADSNTATMALAATEDIKTSIPQTWQLYQNYPNPFNPSTRIQFDVPEEAGRVPRIAIQIFNILGQKVKTIERGNYDAGRYTVEWNGTNEGGTRVASGVYFYRILAGDYSHTMKMVLIK